MVPGSGDVPRRLLPVMTLVVMVSLNAMAQDAKPSAPSTPQQAVPAQPLPPSIIRYRGVPPGTSSEFGVRLAPNPALLGQMPTTLCATRIVPSDPRVDPGIRSDRFPLAGTADTYAIRGIPGTCITDSMTWQGPTGAVWDLEGKSLVPVTPREAPAPPVTSSRRADTALR